jgi:hypothetical protein
VLVDYAFKELASHLASKVLARIRKEVLLKKAQNENAEYQSEKAKAPRVPVSFK